FYVLRQIQDEIQGAASDRKLGEAIRYFSSVEGLKGATPETVEAFHMVFRRLVPNLPDCRSVPSSWLDPGYVQRSNWLNQVSRATSVFRDAWAVKLLMSRVRRGNRVFAVMGASHVAIVEPVLTEGLG